MHVIESMSMVHSADRVRARLTFLILGYICEVLDYANGKLKFIPKVLNLIGFR
jgi:hypothetical protein